MDTATQTFLQAIDRLRNKNDLLQQKVQQLENLLSKANGPRKITGRRIDCGIGQIAISFSGSIDLKELAENLEMCIKNNGVKYTIDVLNGAK